MRVSLEPNGEVFKKQVEGLRRHLNSLHLRGGQEGCSARMMLPVLVPFLTVLRTELRDEVVPEHVMTGAADLLANIALTTVQTMFEAPPLVEGQAVEELLMRACEIACQSIAQEAEGKKPKLSIVPREPVTLSVVHNQTKDEGDKT